MRGSKQFIAGIVLLWGCLGLVAHELPFYDADGLKKYLSSVADSGRVIAAWTHPWNATHPKWRKGLEAFDTEIQRVSGRAPILYFTDFRFFCANGLSERENRTNRASMAAMVKAARNRYGSVPVFSWHPANPYTPAGWTKPGKGTAPYRYRYSEEGYPQEHRYVFREILENTGAPCAGFPNPRAWYDAQLESIADFLNGLRDAEDRPIPAIVRLFHECEDDWSWWGPKSVSISEYVSLFRYSVDVLRKKTSGRSELLFAFSPDRYWKELGEVGAGKGFLVRYPGDAYVDVIGFDDYSVGKEKAPGIEANLKETVRKLRLVGEEARRRGKLCGLFETGVKGAKDEVFYDCLRRIVLADGVRISFANTWAGPWTLPATARGRAAWKAYLADPRIVSLPADGAKVAVDPLEARWTFGNHEPLAMYRRVGNRTTGGLEGGARWLADWAADFDAQAPSRMRELGFNWTHSRFFKGLGWDEERKDFPAVRAFVDNCHSNGVRTLAYVQFATLYHEKFKQEVPDLAEWANYTPDGRHACWHDQYFRWIPCCTSKPFLDYLKRMSEIALKEGRFDGVIFDNVSSQPPCFCDRCRRLFREHLKTIEDPKARFGFDSVDGLDAPAAAIAYGEVQDPLVQEWNRWRANRLVAFFRELVGHIHAIEPQAVVAGNVTDLRRANALGSVCLDVPELASLFDLIMGQSGNVPGARDGCIVNRVRDLKLATALGCPNLSLCDGDAGIAREDEKFYLLPLVEDAVWGGIPTDRTILTPARGKGHFDEDLIARRRPLLQAFNAYLTENRRAFAPMPYAPVALLYPADGIDVSETNWRGLMSAEEILLRRRIPYRILLSRADVGFEIPPGTEVLLVGNQKCLSDREVEAIRNWAIRGGKTIITGVSGDSDEWNRQRFANPFEGLGQGRPNVVRRTDPDLCEIPSGEWTYLVRAPKDGGDRLVADLAKVGFTVPVAVDGLPPAVFAEFKSTPNGYAVHLLNYDPSVKASGGVLKVPFGCSVVFREPFADGVVRRFEIGPDGTGRLPEFQLYASIEITPNKKENET